jgi:DUF1680 family protein
MKPGGWTFYYSDYNNSGSKFYYEQQWPCCSGTFPQVTADYGISSYFHSADGVYVNLFVPSRVTWRRGGGKIALEQETQYPYSPDVTMHIQIDRPETFAVQVRVPAWAGPGTKIAVNGRPFSVDLRPGTFAAIRREWKSGDRIEYHIDMPLRLEAIDPQHPQVRALLVGPLALFAVDSPDSRFTRAQLQAAQQRSTGSMDWLVQSATGTVTFRSFPAIGEEKYRLYHDVAV